MSQQYDQTVVTTATASPHHGFWSGAWMLVRTVTKWLVVLVALVALVRILTFKSLFGTTSGFLMTDLGLSDYAALPLATLITILATGLLAPLLSYFVFGHKPLRAFLTLFLFALGAGALGLFSENLLPDRVYMCRPDEVQFFTRKGASKIFYARVGERYEFFNRPGVHPQRGIEIQAVTPRIAGQLLDSFETGKTLETKSECQFQRVAAAQREAETRRTANRSFAERLLSWLDLGHPDNELPSQPAPTSPVESTKRDPIVRTQPTGSDGPSSATSQLPMTPPAYHSYLTVGKDSSITVYDIEGDHADLAGQTLKSRMVEGDMRSFNARFRDDGLFKRIFGGDARALADLHLPPEVHQVLLARTRISRTENPNLQGMVKVLYVIDVRSLDPATGSVTDMREFSAQGAGFSDETAWAQVRDRLAAGS